MRCDIVDWMLLVQDGPEVVFEHDVKSLELLRDCQILKNSALCSHSCGTMQNKNHSKSIIKVNKRTKRFYWRMSKEVRKRPQGVTLLALSHLQIFFFLPAYVGSRAQSAPPLPAHHLWKNCNSSDGCICSVATTACLYLVTPAQARGQPSLGSSTCKCNEGFVAGREQTDVELLWAQRSEVVSDCNLSLQFSVYLLVPIVISSCLYLSVNGSLSNWIETG